MPPLNRREYDLNRYHQRRHKLVVHLGGVCVGCGTTEELQFDHVDPSTKKFNIGQNMFKPWNILLAEVEKCQLLCRPCHKEKSDKESAVGHGEGKSGKKNCPCPLCKTKKSAYNKQYKSKAI